MNSMMGVGESGFIERPYQEATELLNNRKTCLVSALNMELLTELKAEQTQFLQRQAKISEESLKNITENIAATQNIQGLILEQLLNSKDCKVCDSYSHEVKAKDISKELKELDSAVEALKKLFLKNVKPRQMKINWAEAGMKNFYLAAERQKRIAIKIQSLSITIETLESIPPTLKESLQLEFPAIEIQTGVILVSNNFNKKIVLWKELAEKTFDQIAEDYPQNLTNYLFTLNGSMERVNHFFLKFSIMNLTISEGDKEVREQLNYIKNNNAIPELRLWKESLEKSWDRIASKRLKLSINRHLIEAYAQVIPSLRALRNTSLLHLKTAYDVRKKFENLANSPEMPSMFCMRSTSLSAELQPLFNRSTDLQVEAFVKDNQELTDIYDACKRYFAEAKEVKIGSSQPSFLEIPYDPKIEENETKYFLNPASVQDIIQEIKEESQVEKIRVWKMILEEIHLVKKIMLLYSAQVNCLVDAQKNRGVFKNVRCFDLTRTNFADPNLCAYRPADPISPDFSVFDKGVLPQEESGATDGSTEVNDSEEKSINIEETD